MIAKIKEINPISLNRMVNIEFAPSAKRKINPKIAERTTGNAKYQANQTPLVFQLKAKIAAKIVHPRVITLKN